MMIDKGPVAAVGADDPGQRRHDRAVSGLVARAVTEVFSPAVVVIALPIVVAWHATGRIGPTIGWGLLVALFTSILPMAFIIRGARRGRWDGHHVRNREGRLLPLSLGLGSTAVGLVILLLAHAPRDVIALDVAMLGMLVVSMVVTRWWKISLHSAVAGGAVATLVLLYGPALLWLIAVVVLVAWSRVRLADHTLAQVVVGAVTGPLVGGALFLSIR